ncbi:Plastocyanin [uncultured archaeon]|nr:Plastocyanin [uncultured archaeon]
MAKGAAVTWTNEDSAPHTITSSTGAFDSGTLQQGQSFSFKFDTPGTYEYHCAIHSRMKGKITVTG